MGFLNFIGSITIGEIVQAVSAIVEPAFKHTDGTTFSTSITSCDVTFYRKTYSDGSSQIMAGNFSDIDFVSAIVPNDDVTGNDGVEYYIGKNQSLEFTNAKTSPAATNITTWPINNGIKVPFTGLKLHGTGISTGLFKLSCNTTQLIVASEWLVLSAISYMFFKSNRGTTAIVLNSIKPVHKDGGSQYVFDVNFASMGFDMTRDVLDGLIILDAQINGNDGGRHSTTNSKPFSEAENAYFRWLKEQKHV